MIHYLTFAGKSSQDFGVYISGAKSFGSGERDYEQISVPGRSGDLLLDNGRYKNVTVSYEAYIARNFRENYNAFNAWLMSQNGYQRLEDTYQPEIYRMGNFSVGLQSEPVVRLGVGSFTIDFNCKPQKYLKSGEQAITFTANGYIYNPTLFTAKPLFHLYGTAGDLAAINVGSSQEIDITLPESGEAYIDSELGEAYDTDGTSLNSVMTFSETSNPDQVFPVIPSGQQAVLMYNVTSLEVIPRWWTI